MKNAGDNADGSELQQLRKLFHEVFQSDNLVISQQSVFRVFSSRMTCNLCGGFEIDQVDRANSFGNSCETNCSDEVLGTGSWVVA